MNKKILIGIILKKKNNKIPIILCEFDNITTYINENNTIIQETHLEINNIQEIFYSKIQFISWLKNNGNYGKIPFNKCWNDKLYDYIQQNNITYLNNIL